MDAVHRESWMVRFNPPARHPTAPPADATSTTTDSPRERYLPPAGLSVSIRTPYLSPAPDYEQRSETSPGFARLLFPAQKPGYANGPRRIGRYESKCRLTMEKLYIFFVNKENIKLSISGLNLRGKGVRYLLHKLCKR